MYVRVCVRLLFLLLLLLSIMCVYMCYNNSTTAIPFRECMVIILHYVKKHLSPSPYQKIVNAEKVEGLNFI